jgi:hypothetical protein
MNEKIEECLRDEHYHIEDAGDGIFICLDYEPGKEEQRELIKTASKFYEDVQWCPDPSSHFLDINESEEAVSVLNCFYPISR